MPWRACSESRWTCFEPPAWLPSSTCFARDRFDAPQAPAHPRTCTALPRPIIEFYYKADELNDPMVAEEHITAFNWASTQEIDDMMAMTLRVNDFLSGLFAAVGIRLVDFKVEYGRLYEGDHVRIVLADEISPDCCRLWDMITNDKMDKDRFRRDLGNVTEAYAEVARRLGIMKDAPPSLKVVGEDGD